MKAFYSIKLGFAVYIIADLSYNKSNIEKGLPMPINVDLLIAAPVLQDYLVDKDGTPMSGGTVTCYHDNSRTTLKNWYYQSGTPGNYTYITLPNPLTLSAAGTICDINGVDTIPFFYPYDELDEEEPDPYYITIVNYAQTNQITRANFPFMGESSGGATAVNTFNNLIVNGSFWRNLQPNTVNVTPYTSVTLNNIMAIPPGGTYYAAVVAPSQHDGFRMPDVQFQKNNLTGTDIVTFIPFPLGFGQPINNSILPEYYLSHTCSAAGNTETQKCYQFPISLHVNTLDSVPFTFSIQAQNGGGTGTAQDVITVFILQDPGTGGIAVPAKEIGQITPSSSWETYTISNLFTSSSGLNLGKGSDDGWYLQIQMPLNTICTINFTKPSIYLTNNIVPTNSFETYDQIDPIINGFRTGDIRTSLNAFSPFGWVPANDGTIGSNSSGATTRANADTWPLYSLLWNAVSNTYAPVAGGRGASAYADFTANKTIQLTLTLSRVLGSVGPGAGLTNWALGQNTGAETQSHTLTINEMPAHTHPGVSPSFGLGTAQSAGGGAGIINNGGYNMSVATQGGGAAFTISDIQPSVFYNVFFKL